MPAKGPKDLRPASDGKTLFRIDWHLTDEEMSAIVAQDLSKGNISLGESASKALTLPAAYAGKPIEPKGEVEEPVPSFVMPLLLGTVGFALFLVVKD